MKDAFEFDEKKHVYTLNGKKMYGITNVLSVISKPALIQWAADEACKHVVNGIGACIGPLGIFEGEPFDNLLKEARLAHRKKKEDAAEAGTDTHSLVENWVNWCIKEHGGLPVINLDIDGPDCGSIKHFCNWAAENKIRFLESEKRLYSEEMWVAGTCDLIFEKDGKTYIGDIKTYKKLWDRTPMLQCAGYGLMWEEMRHSSFIAADADMSYAEWMERGKIDGYCVIRIKDGEFEVKWSYAVEDDRKGFLAALTLFKVLENWVV